MANASEREAFEREAFERVHAEQQAFARAIAAGRPALGALDLDALAEGVAAHRAGKAFHENPYGSAEVKTVRRLSWSIGWNERALRENERAPALS